MSDQPTTDAQELGRLLALADMDDGVLEDAFRDVAGAVPHMAQAALHRALVASAEQDYEDELADLDRSRARAIRDGGWPSESEHAAGRAMLEKGRDEYLRQIAGGDV
jgi:hypothetical protein